MLCRNYKNLSAIEYGKENSLSEPSTVLKLFSDVNMLFQLKQPEVLFIEILIAAWISN